MVPLAVYKGRYPMSDGPMRKRLLQEQNQNSNSGVYRARKEQQESKNFLQASDSSSIP